MLTRLLSISTLALSLAACGGGGGGFVTTIPGIEPDEFAALFDGGNNDDGAIALPGGRVVTITDGPITAIRSSGGDREFSTPTDDQLLTLACFNTNGVLLWRRTLPRRANFQDWSLSNGRLVALATPSDDIDLGDGAIDLGDFERAAVLVYFGQDGRFDEAVMVATGDIANATLNMRDDGEFHLGVRGRGDVVIGDTALPSQPRIAGDEPSVPIPTQLYIARFAPDFMTRWISQSTNDEGWFIIQELSFTPDGDCVAAFETNELPVYFEGTPDRFEGPDTDRSDRGVVFRLDAVDSSLDWFRSLEGDVVIRDFLHHGGGTLLCGSFRAEADFGDGRISTDGLGNWACLVAYDNDGSLLWKRIGGDSSESATLRSAQRIDAESFVVVGSVASNTTDRSYSVDSLQRRRRVRRRDPPLHAGGRPAPGPSAVDRIPLGIHLAVHRRGRHDPRAWQHPR